MGITDEGAVLRRGDEIFTIPCDNVVLAIGTRSHAPLAEELKDIVDTVVVGDAVKARQAIQASREGFYAGLTV